MIRIDFNRRTGSASCGGVQTQGEAMSDVAMLDMTRVLVNLSHPDEPIVFHDERGMPCMDHRSLHECARRYRPTIDEKEAQLANAAARAAAAKQQKARKDLAA